MKELPPLYRGLVTERMRLILGWFLHTYVCMYINGVRVQPVENLGLDEEF